MKQTVNLYTAELQPRREYLTARGAMMLIVGVLVLVVLVFVGLSVQHHSRLERLAELEVAVEQTRDEMAGLSAELEAKRTDPELERSLERLNQQVRRRSAMFERIERLVRVNNQRFSPFLEALARQAPADLWLTGFRIAFQPDHIQLRGEALHSQQIPLYLQRLREEPVFTGRTFRQFLVERPEPGSSNALAFRIASDRPEQESSDD